MLVFKIFIIQNGSLRTHLGQKRQINNTINSNSSASNKLFFNTFLMMPSAEQGRSNNPPPSPSKDSLDALSKLIEDKFASLEACIVSVEDQINSRRPDK